MMSWFPIWLAVGLIAGGLHAGSLWYAARHAQSLAAASGMLRLVLVAIVLVGAALAGGLLPACAGWGVGFAAVAGIYLLGSRSS